MNLCQNIIPFAELDTFADESKTEWYAALQARETAKAAFEAYEAEVYCPLDAILDRIAPRPELAFDIDLGGGRIGTFMVPANDLHKWDTHPSPLVREAATAIREAWLGFLSVRRLIGWEAASDELERLCKVQCDLERDLVVMPAPDLPALRWKLDHLFGADAREPDDYGPSWCAEFLNAILTDSAHLLCK